MSIRLNMVKRLLLILRSLAMVFGVGASVVAANAPRLAQVAASNNSETGPRKIIAGGVDNLFQLGEKLYAGAAPEGDQGFETLHKLGIKTVITVDGTQPDVERAHAHGMRYIHLPHGYDGIPAEVQVQLVKAFKTVEGPVFIHCHHGKHRAPVAAAVICMATQDWSPAQAEAWLRIAGTGANYQGLFATVRNFKKPNAEQLEKAPTSFPESRKVSDLVEAMVSIDQTFDRIKSLRAAAPSRGPDNHLLNEAALLHEHFREAQRLPDAKKHGKDFLTLLGDSEDYAASFEQSLSSSADPIAQDRAFQLLANSCASCHRDHRDRPPSGKNASPLPR